MSDLREAEKAHVLDQAHAAFPAFLDQREKVARMREWLAGRPPNGEGPYRPLGANPEYQDLESQSTTPWLGLVVSSAAQAIFLDGVRRRGQQENLAAWETWQRNGWDARQGPLYRAALSDGIAYGIALPAASGGPVKLKARSALTFVAFYAEEEDDYPFAAMNATTAAPVSLSGSREQGWDVEWLDDEGVHKIRCTYNGENRREWSYLSFLSHGLKLCPVVRYTNMVDLEGRATGEIEPLIPLARRIDQDTFDRLIVQRFGAWKVRFIAGMAMPASGDVQAEKMRLRVEDILVSDDPETKFGTLAATELAGFIAARDADLRDFAAVSQTPPHYLLGSMINVGSEGLAAAEATLMRKVQERRVTFGESHERLFRLSALIRGDSDEADAWDMEVRWRNMESRSLSQAADAIGKLVTMVGVPAAMAFELIPGWTDTDVQRALDLVDDGAADTLFDTLTRQIGEPIAEPAAA